MSTVNFGREDSFQANQTGEQLGLAGSNVPKTCKQKGRCKTAKAGFDETSALQANENALDVGLQHANNDLASNVTINVTTKSDSNSQVQASTRQHVATPILAEQPAAVASSIDTVQTPSVDCEFEGLPNTAPTQDSGAIANSAVTAPPRGLLARPFTARELLKSLEKLNHRPFVDNYSRPFLFVKHGSSFRCIGLNSSELRLYLFRLAGTFSSEGISASDLRSVIEELKLLATEVTIPLEVRLKQAGDDVLIDLANKENQMVRLSQGKVIVQQQEDPHFYRPDHLLPLATPCTPCAIEEIFNYIPIDGEDKRLLFLAWMVSALHPGITSPMLLMLGEQGSAKTTRSLRIKSLLDPSKLPVLGDVDNSRLFNTFQQHALPCFENVSKFERKVADMFCRAVTGNGVERRKLFTDSDSVHYSYKRPIIINGIHSPTIQPDFVDRCLTFQFQRLKTFCTLPELDKQFEAKRAELFSALLELAARSFQLLKSTNSVSSMRMADFVHLGRAVSTALGKPQLDFDAALKDNTHNQSEDILDGTPMYQALIALARKYKLVGFTGTAEQALEELRYEAFSRNLRDARATLPKNARALSQKLTDLASILEPFGVKISKLPRTSTCRGWHIVATGRLAEQIANGELDNLDDGDLFRDSGVQV